MQISIFDGGRGFYFDADQLSCADLNHDINFELVRMGCGGSCLIRKGTLRDFGGFYRVNKRDVVA